MNAKKTILLALIATGLLLAAWYLDLGHRDVETIDELIGKNYDYAHKSYFGTDPDGHYPLNTNRGLNEFDGDISSQLELLKDSIVHVYTWEYARYKKTIWVGKTKRMDMEVLDALRYKKDVQF